VTGDRSISEVLQDILRNVQELLRSEVRLAKAEIREEATRAASSLVWVAAGIAGVLSAWIFLLWTAVYALSTVMAMWAATLVVAVVVAIAGSLSIAAGLRRFRQVSPIPERTVESIKENLEWIKQPTR
jgi:hypothetical protein